MAYGAIVGQQPDTTKIEQKIDNIEKNYVPKSGTTMTGALNMSNHKVSGVANGTDNGDAVNKGQLDAVKNSAASVPFAGVFKLIGHKTGFLEKPSSVNFGQEITLTDKANGQSYIVAYVFPDLGYDYRNSAPLMPVYTKSMAYDTYNNNSVNITDEGSTTLCRIEYKYDDTIVLKNYHSTNRYGPCYYDIYIYETV